MSKLNEETIDVLQALIDRADHDHTEYSLEDCKSNANILDRAEILLNYYTARRTIEECRPQNYDVNRGYNTI